MKRYPIPPGIAMELLKNRIPMSEHERVIDAMADAGDWYAVHWRSCGLLQGVMSIHMCRQGHKPDPDAIELSREDVRELAERLGAVTNED